MKTQTGITTIECAVMLASIDSTPSFCFSTDLDASLADTVQDTLTALLGVDSREYRLDVHAQSVYVSPASILGRMTSIAYCR